MVMGEWIPGLTRADGGGVAFASMNSFVRERGRKRGFIPEEDDFGWQTEPSGPGSFMQIDH